MECELRLRSLSLSEKKIAQAFSGQCDQCRKFFFKADLVDVSVETDAETIEAKTCCKRCANLYEARIFRASSDRYGIPAEVADFLAKKFKSSFAASKGGSYSKTHSIMIDEVFRLWTFQGGRCALTGRGMSIGAGYSQASIDRIDNKRGYDPGNIHLVCWAVNMMKQTMTVAQLRDWASAIAGHAA